MLLLIPLAIAPTIFATSQSVIQGVRVSGPDRILPSTLQVWPEGTGIYPAIELSALVPSHPVLYQHPLASSGTNIYYVGAQAPIAVCGATCTYLTNTGVRTTIQVVSQKVSGCLSYWIGDDSNANLWGQVGYYICNGATPVAFYQIWNMTTHTILVTGTTSVSTGYHQFSMYLQSGTKWAYALDGGIFGMYDMKASISSKTYPVQTMSEETNVNSPWNPGEVQISTVMEVLNSGVWSPVQTAGEPWGCSSSTNSCWGVQGNLQSSTIPNNALVIGGNAPVILSGTTLWNGVGSTSTTSTSTSSTSSSTTSSSSSSSSTYTSTTSSSQSGGSLQVSLTITPSSNTRKSTEYFTVQVTDQYGNMVGGASVSLKVIAPNGKSTSITATTDASGAANLKYKLSAAAPLGTYTVSAVASLSGYVSSSSTGTFTVS